MRFQHEKIAMKEAALRNLACQECGEKIEQPEAMFCNHCHAPIVRRYCAGCSHLVPENSAYCPLCGTSAKEPIPERFGLITKIVPVALGLLMLTIFIGREDNNAARHATARRPAQLTEGSGGQGFSELARQDTRATITAAASTVDISQDGRRLNEEAHDLMLQRKYAEAIPLLQQSIRAFGPGSKDEGYAFALFNLAQSFRMSGKPEKGLPILEHLVQTHADNPLFQHELIVTQGALTPQPTAAEATVN
jgi:RNA polymerase subunit RPABC4/transcription elongation factor Spt4